MPGELKSTGRLGEDLAARFLEASGAEIIARNVRPGTGCGVRGELDILCLDGQTLCVVEVKTLRRRGGGMTPGMNVTAAKQHWNGWSTGTTTIFPLSVSLVCHDFKLEKKISKT